MILEISTKERQWLIEILKQIKTKEAEKVLRKVEKVHKIKPRSAKNKGLLWQKEVAEMIARITGCTYKQDDDECLIHSRESGLQGVDVIVRGKAKDLFNYAIECKAAEKVSLSSWIEQARQNSENENWLIFIKNRSVGKVVVMPIATFEEEFNRQGV